ncbi:hypothetical protein COOONC_07943, partial [Cooperia oncophora]
LIYLHSSQGEWDEDTADLVEEAATLIRELEREYAERENEEQEEEEEDEDEESSEEEEPVVEIRRSERPKKLSVKAQELLDLTIRNMKLKDKQNEEGFEVPQYAFAGYDGQCRLIASLVDRVFILCLEGSDSSSSSDDDDSSDDEAGPSTMFYRKRQAPRVTMTSSRLSRRNVESERTTTSTPENPVPAFERHNWNTSIYCCCLHTTGLFSLGLLLDESAATVMTIKSEAHEVLSGPGSREAEPAEHVPSKLTTSPADRQDGNVPPIETDTPTSGGDLQRVKHSKTSLASRSLKSEGPRPSPVRKRPFEKAKPNIKVKKSRATSHSVEEAKSTPASSATDATVPEAPAADEAQDTVSVDCKMNFAHNYFQYHF